MTDTTTHEPLAVTPHETAGPYLIVPYSQLAEVRSLLDEKNVSYEVDEQAYSLNGAPEVIFVNFQRGTDPEFIQQLLDSLP